MKVWLTGGTGFVGSNIVHVALERGRRGDDNRSQLSAAVGDGLRHRSRWT